MTQQVDDIERATDDARRRLLRHGLWSAQSAIMRALSRHKRVIVKSGHGTGKTWVAARAARAYLLSGAATGGAIILTLAPTDRQVRKAFWGTFRRQLHLAGGVERFFPRDALSERAPRLFLDDGWWMEGFSPASPEYLQGIHHANLFVVVDEAPGMSPEMMEAIESLQPRKMLLIGNPVDSGGHFYDAFLRPGPDAVTLTVSCLQHPNVVTGLPVIPGAVTREWVEERRVQWGEDSPAYASRVLGEFPAQSDTALIALAWVEAALNAEWPDDDGRDDAPTMGVDIARYGGDRTVIIIQRGGCVLECAAWHGQDLMATAGRVVQLARKYTVAASDIRVDDTGLGGGVTDRLREQGMGVDAVNFGARPRQDPEQFRNLAAELWWTMRERLRAGQVDLSRMAGTREGQDLVGELVGRRYTVTSSGKTAVESKDGLRKRGVSSPDIADALALALMPPQAMGIFFA